MMVCLIDRDRSSADLDRGSHGCVPLSVARKPATDIVTKVVAVHRRPAAGVDYGDTVTWTWCVILGRFDGDRIHPGFDADCDGCRGRLDGRLVSPCGRWVLMILRC